MIYQRQPLLRFFACLSSYNFHPDFENAVQTFQLFMNEITTRLKFVFVFILSASLVLISPLCRVSVFLHFAKSSLQWASISFSAVPRLAFVSSSRFSSPLPYLFSILLPSNYVVVARSYYTLRVTATYLSSAGRVVSYLFLVWRYDAPAKSMKLFPLIPSFKS